MQASEYSIAGLANHPAVSGARGSLEEGTFRITGPPFLAQKFSAGPVPEDHFTRSNLSNEHGTRSTGFFGFRGAFVDLGRVRIRARGAPVSPTLWVCGADTRGRVIWRTFHYDEAPVRSATSTRACPTYGGLHQDER